MIRLALLVMLAALAACGSKAPPGPPTAEAIGAELATFPQLLVPISSGAWAGMNRIAAAYPAATPDLFPQPYAHGSAEAGGRTTAFFLGYASVWQAPAAVPLQPMSVQQFLRAFAADAATDHAGVIAPKGTIFFTREQLAEVMGAARTAGSTSADLPFMMVVGAGK